ILIQPGFVTRLEVLSVGIVDVVAIRPLKEYIQVKILIPEVVGETSEMNGEASSNESPVIGIYDAVAIQVLVFDITRPDIRPCISICWPVVLQHIRAVGLQIEVGILVETIEDIAIELTQGLSHLGKIQ